MCDRYALLMLTTSPRGRGQPDQSTQCSSAHANRSEHPIFGQQSAWLDYSHSDAMHIPLLNDTMMGESSRGAQQTQTFRLREQSAMTDWPALSRSDNKANANLRRTFHGRNKHNENAQKFLASASNAGTKSPYTREEMEYLTEAIVSNDIIMQCICKNLVSIKDRLSLELSSSRLLDCSRMSPYDFRSHGDHLDISFKTLNDLASVCLGDTWCVVPVRTAETRRQGAASHNDDVTKQPHKFVSVLNGISSRFSHRAERLDVRRVTLGGTSQEDVELLGVRNHQLILTSDLCMFLNDCLPRMEELRLTDLGIDEVAQQYLSSSSCSFPLRLTRLSINSVWCDGHRRAGRERRDDFHVVVRLITAALRHLSILSFTDEGLADASLVRLSQVGARLESIELQVDEFSMSTPREARSIFDRAGKAAQSVRLIFAVIEPAHPYTPLFKVIRECARGATNITHLDVSQMYAANAEQCACYASFLRRLRLLPLVSLRLAGWRVSSAVGGRRRGRGGRGGGMGGAVVAVGVGAGGGAGAVCVENDLTSALAACTKLEELHLGALPHCLSREALEAMASAIPASVKDLSIDGAQFDDDDLISVFERTRLRSVKLHRLPRASTVSVALLLQERGQHLERASILIPVSPLLLRPLASRSRLPALRWTQLQLAGQPQQHVLQLLRECFSRVDGDDESASYPQRRTWHVAVSGRKDGVTVPAGFCELNGDMLLRQRREREERLARKRQEEKDRKEQKRREEIEW